MVKSRRHIILVEVGAQATASVVGQFDSTTRALGVLTVGAHAATTPTRSADDRAGADPKARYAERVYPAWRLESRPEGTARNEKPNRTSPKSRVPVSGMALGVSA